MNMNAKFLKEAKTLEAKWHKSGLLKDIDKTTIANMMECERLHNETGTWDCCDHCRERETQEKALDSK